MTTQIKRLLLSNTEFVPITLAEAVVVNTSNIPGLKTLGITTLDKVLRNTLGVVGVNSADINTLKTTVNNINTALEEKQDKLTAGTGIDISSTGVISVTTSVELYKIVTTLPTPSKSLTNSIYLLPLLDGIAGNRFVEYICVPTTSSTDSTYIWEQVGEIQTDIDLSGYVTKEEFNAFKTNSISAEDVTLSNGTTKVVVNYTIPNNLYDNMINVDVNDHVTGG